MKRKRNEKALISIMENFAKLSENWANRLDSQLQEEEEEENLDIFSQLVNSTQPELTVAEEPPLKRRKVEVAPELVDASTQTSDYVFLREKECQFRVRSFDAEIQVQPETMTNDTQTINQAVMGIVPPHVHDVLKLDESSLQTPNKFLASSMGTPHRYGEQNKGKNIVDNPVVAENDSKKENDEFNPLDDMPMNDDFEDKMAHFQEIENSTNSTSYKEYQKKSIVERNEMYSSDKCKICHLELMDGSDLYSLQYCGHTFHLECVERSIATRNIPNECVVCTQQILSDEMKKVKELFLAGERGKKMKKKEQRIVLEEVLEEKQNE